MAVTSFAPVYEHYDLTASAAATTIADGEYFRVYGIQALSVGTCTITFTDTAGNTLLVIRLSATTPFVNMNIPFLVDAGLKASCITSSASITILRSHSGT